MQVWLDIKRNFRKISQTVHDNIISHFYPFWASFLRRVLSEQQRLKNKKINKRQREMDTCRMQSQGQNCYIDTCRDNYTGRGSPLFTEARWIRRHLREEFTQCLGYAREYTSQEKKNDLTIASKGFLAGQQKAACSVMLRGDMPRVHV